MANKEYEPTGFWGMVSTVLGKFLSNIHGTDATMLALCGMMYLLLVSESIKDNPLASTALDYTFYLACVVMVGRVAITMIKRK